MFTVGDRQLYTYTNPGQANLAYPVPKIPAGGLQPWPESRV